MNKTVDGSVPYTTDIGPFIYPGPDTRISVIFLFYDAFKLVEKQRNKLRDLCLKQDQRCLTFVGHKIVLDMRTKWFIDKLI